MKKGVLAAVTALGAAVGMSAFAAPVGAPITIEESAIAGAGAHEFTADQLSGQYDEVFTATGATTFATEAIFEAGGWFENSAALATQVNGFGAAGYGLYAKFSSTGTFSVSGSDVTFTGGSGVIELWADADFNTDYDVDTTATGSVGNLVLASGGASILDDVLLGSAMTLIAGEGNATDGLANGNFELLFGDFALTSPEGEAYFIAPRPFHIYLDVNGNFQGFLPTVGFSIQLLNNSANAFFLPVPEPSTLALVGLALVGLGASATRRKHG